MRFMAIVKATQDSEAGVMPTEKALTEMGKFNEELVKAGVMLAGEGLQPSSKGARVNFNGNKRSVTDGPFAETKELVAGFWLLQAKSLQEAIEWIKRAPNPAEHGESVVKIRQIFEAEARCRVHAEARAQEERLRAELDARRNQTHATISSTRSTDMQIEPYLFFDGRCEEALEFYRKAHRRRNHPVDAIQGKSGAEQRHDAAGFGQQGHARFLPRRRIHDRSLRRELPRRSRIPGLFAVDHRSTDAEADRLFAALGEGGNCASPLDQDVLRVTGSACSPIASA